MIRCRSLRQLRLVMGFAIVASGLVVCLGTLFTHLDRDAETLGLALKAGMWAAFATGMGALPVLWVRRISQRGAACMLAFGGGMMMAATITALLVPAIGALRDEQRGFVQIAVILIAGAFAGALALAALERLRLVKDDGGSLPAGLERSAFLLLTAVCLHNIPEGFALGAGFAAPEASRAAALTLGISVQDVPEGLLVAWALRCTGSTRLIATIGGMLSGAIEPIAAVLGAMLVGASPFFMPTGLCIAAGAMLYVVCHEIIPESHASGRNVQATLALMLGLILMVLLDTQLE